MDDASFPERAINLFSKQDDLQPGSEGCVFTCHYRDGNDGITEAVIAICTVNIHEPSIIEVMDALLEEVRETMEKWGKIYFRVYVKCSNHNNDKFKLSNGRLHNGDNVTLNTLNILRSMCVAKLAEYRQ